jgi:hypothetical protein
MCTVDIFSPFPSYVLYKRIYTFHISSLSSSNRNIVVENAVKSLPHEINPPNYVYPESHSLLFLHIPRTRLTQRAFPHRSHNILLHILTPLLQIPILTLILPLPSLLPHMPDPNNEYRDGDSDGPVDPESVVDDRTRVLEVEECHAEDGGEVCAREEDGTKERDCFHGC